MQNLSQENIATELGISIGAYSNIERGKSEVTVTRLYDIARILKTSITDLLLSKNDIGEKPVPQEYPRLTDKEFLEISEMKEQLNSLQKEVASIKSGQAKKPRRK